MVRTTVMADEELLRRVRAVAEREGLSMAEVIRQGMELRTRPAARRRSFIGAVAAPEPHDTAATADALHFEPPAWH